MCLYAYRVPIELDAFCYVLEHTAAGLVQLCQKGSFSNSKIWKKHKNVSAMSKKTSGCTRKIIKNGQKRRKTTKIGAADVNLIEKGVFLPYFGP